MAEVTLHPDPQLFPPGTAVKVYLRPAPESGVPLVGEPSGAVVKEAVVAGSGALVITGLAESGRYVAWAVVSGADRYLRFQTDGTTSAVSSSRTTTVFAASSFGLSPAKTAAENGIATEALQAFLAEEGNVTVVLPYGIKTNKGLIIKSPGVTLRGGGLEPSNAGYAITVVAAATDCTIEGVTITGAGATGGIRGEGARLRLLNNVISAITSTSAAEGQGSGIFVTTDDARVEGNHVFNCGGEHSSNQFGAIKATGESGVYGRRITIARNRCHGNSTHGVYVTGCDGMQIEGNYCYENGKYASESGNPEPYGRGITIGTQPAVGVKVVNNFLYENWENGLIVSGAGAVNCVISGNHAYRNNKGAFPGGHGIESDVAGAIIANNVCYENHNGISFGGLGTTVTGNRCYSNKEVESEPVEQGCGIKGFHIGAEEALEWIILGNDCHSNDNVGLSLKAENSANGPTVIGNRLYSNGVKNNAGANYDLLVNNKLKGGFYESNATHNTAFKVSIADPTPFRRANTSGSGAAPIKNFEIKTGVASLTFSGEGWEYALIKVVNKEPCTIKAPEQAWSGRTVTFMFYNSSGEEMGALTWEKEGEAGGFLKSAFATPKTGKKRTITFVYDGERWLEIAQTAEH